MNELFLGIILLLAGFDAYLLLMLLKIKNNQKVLLTGTKNTNLEDGLIKMVSRLDQTDLDIDLIKKQQLKLHRDSLGHLQKTGFVRFNPFDDTGGDQSFAVCLLDANDNGLVISSIHSRTSTRTFSKPVKNGKSEYHLTDEEKQAIKIAQSN